MWNLILKAALGELGPLIAAVVQALQNRKVLDLAVGFAGAEVQRLAGDTSLDNEAKRRTAAQGVQAAVKAAGYDIAGSLANLVVEAAVNAMKAKVGL